VFFDFFSQRQKPKTFHSPVLFPDEATEDGAFPKRGRPFHESLGNASTPQKVVFSTSA